MDDRRAYQQMQDEMSRFEAEISTNPDGTTSNRPVIGANTFGVVKQQLERLPPPPPPPTMLGQFNPSMGQMMGPRLMYPTVPPPPPPPNMMVPASVQRHRPMHPGGFMPPGMPMNPMMGRMPGHPGMPGRPGMPGPQALPKQPAILSAAPKLYNKNKDNEKKEKESRKRKKSKSPPPPPPKPEPVPVRIPTPPPVVPPVAPPVPVYTEAQPPTKPKKEKKSRKVVRTAGGQVWEDVTLLDWPDDDFRMFCGDLGNDVTDELLTRTFGKYTSFQRAKVVRDRRTNKSKGFGFVSFTDPGDFIKAMKEMDGRYVGSRPIKLRKSSWKNRSLDIVRKKEKEKAALLSLLMNKS